jgi:hypothetical protein
LVPFNAVAGVSSTQVYVVGGQAGGDGVVFAYDGVAWVNELGPHSAPALFAVTADAQGSAWAAGADGAVITRLYGAWSAEVPPRPGAPTWLAIAAVHDGMLAVGLDGHALSHDFMTWNSLSVPTQKSLLGLVALPDGTTLVSGEQGLLLRRDTGGTWHDESLPTQATLWSLCTAGGTVVMAVGDRGTSFIHE